MVVNREVVADVLRSDLISWVVRWVLGLDFLNERWGFWLDVKLILSCYNSCVKV